MATPLDSVLRRVNISSDTYTEWKVVAAIDFGTSNSGYAFAFRNTEPVSAYNIQLNKWQMNLASSATEKAPTSVLLNPDKTFNSFGFKAENHYARLCDQKREKGWWYFHKFKMILHDKKLSRDDQMCDAEGKQFPAIQVFSAVISYLKECIINDIKIQNSHVKDEEILYVLTVPAIWSDGAKQFMREAATAKQVGIKDKQLNIVLEPEAASVYCRQTKCGIIRQKDGKTKIASLAVGQKYIILDLGGGTADIATHEILRHGQLCELNNTRGNDVAGQKFNSNFLELLYDIFGEETIRNWQILKNKDNLKLLRTIEGCKREVSDSNDGVYFDIPNSLVKYYENISGRSHEEAIQSSRYKDQIEPSDDLQLHLKADLLRSLFESILKELTTHVNKIVKESPRIDTIFLVGGLSKSSYICQFIQRQFPQVKIVVPEDPGVAVLKGAVMLGERPQTIASRLARYSYGIRLAEPFVKGKHKEEYKFTRDGIEWCDHIFRKLIEKGKVLKYGDTFETTTYINAKLPETKKMLITSRLYQSVQPSPMYTTEEGCKCIGTIKMYPPEGGWPDYCELKVTIVVGEAELKFYVKDDLGREYETKVDFLGESIS